MSARAATSGRHSGWTITTAPGWRARAACDVLRQDPGVGGAEPRPGDEVAPGLSGHEGGQIPVGDEDDLLGILEDLLDHPDGVRRRAAQVALRLDLGRGVHIAEDLRPGMLRLQGAELLGRDHVRHRAAGVLVRQKDGLSRREDLRRLRHEMHPAEDDHLRVRLRGLDAQSQGIADEIGDVLNLGNLVVVGQDDRLAFLLQPLVFFQRVPPIYLLNDPPAQDGLAVIEDDGLSGGNGLLRLREPDREAVALL